MSLTLGQYLKKAREENDYSQQTVCESVNSDIEADFSRIAADLKTALPPEIKNSASMSVNQLKKYEADLVQPPLSVLTRLCDIYDADWEGLYRSLQYSVHDYYPRLALMPSATPKPKAKRGAPSKSARIENGKIAEGIVEAEFERAGWAVRNVNDDRPNYPNYDLIAERDGQVIRIQVKGKKHETKASLCGSYDPERPSFNRVDQQGVDKAGFLAMIRFTSEDEFEIFWLTIDEAERKARWFAEEIGKLGNKPIHLYPYVSRKPRQTRFAFNKRDVWEPYSIAWREFINNTPTTINATETSEHGGTMPVGTKWQDCVIVALTSAGDVPGREGSKRHRKNKMALNFVGKEARLWVEAWREIDPTYPVTANNVRMCLKNKLFALRAPDGSLVAELR